MDKIKFVMTNTSDIVTEVCREALEAKGVTVMVCDKNGTAALETLLAVHPQACLMDAFMQAALRGKEQQRRTYHLLCHRRVPERRSRAGPLR